jgi:hypothetical protein
MRDSLVVVEIADVQGDPLQLVQEAIERRADAAKAAKKARDVNLKFDQVWAVFDVDTHARLDAARRLAAKEGVEIAVSNPCFELWALLHFESHTAHVTARKVAEMLGRHMPGYRKDLDLKLMRGRFDVARQRALELEGMHEKNGLQGGENPSTRAWAVVDALRESARRSGADASKWGL